MERIEAKVRDISFRSEKNGNVVTVHGSFARKVANIFESDETVLRYQTNVTLEYVEGCIDSTGIRASFLDNRWQSDFMVERIDGSIEVYEVVSKALLDKRAVIEKIEFSRRFWDSQHINKWMLYIVEEEDTKW